MNRRTYAIVSLFMVGMIVSGLVGYISATPPNQPTYVQPGSMNTGYDYIVFYYDGDFYAKDGQTGQIVTSSTSMASIMSDIATLLGDEGGLIYSSLSGSVIDTRPRAVNRSEAVTVIAGNQYSFYHRYGAGIITQIWVTWEHDGYFKQDLINITIDGITTSTTIGDFFGFYGRAQDFNYTALNIGGNVDKTNYYGGGYFNIPIYFQDECNLLYTPLTTNGKIFSCVISINETVLDKHTHFTAVKFTTGDVWSYLEDLTFATHYGSPGRLMFFIWTEDSAGTDLYYLEEDPIIEVDGVAINATGTEDFFMNSEYWQNSGDLTRKSCIAPTNGLITMNTTSYTTVCFRDFYGEQNGIWFANSLNFHCIYDENRGTSNVVYGYMCMFEIYE